MGGSLENTECMVTRIENKWGNKRAPWTSDTVSIDGTQKLINWAGTTNKAGTELTLIKAQEPGRPFIYQAAIGANGKAKVSIFSPDGDTGAVAYGMDGGRVFDYGCNTPNVIRPTVDDFARAEEVFKALNKSPGYRDAITGVKGGIFDPVADESKILPKTNRGISPK